MRKRIHLLLEVRQWFERDPRLTNGRGKCLFMTNDISINCTMVSSLCSLNFHCRRFITCVAQHLKQWRIEFSTSITQLSKNAMRFLFNSFSSRQPSSTFHQFNFHKTTKQAELRASGKLARKLWQWRVYIFLCHTTALKLYNTQKIISFNTQRNFLRIFHRCCVFVGTKNVEGRLSFHGKSFRKRDYPKLSKAS